MRSRYNTAQRNEIVSCLAQAKGHLSAADIVSRLAEAGSSVSTATVYRQLEKLAAEGLVVKSTPEGERSACFELVDSHECHETRCYHLKCESCGKLIHLDCNEVDELCHHLLEEHGFRIDTKRTVIFGTCESCSAHGETREGAHER